MRNKHKPQPGGLVSALYNGILFQPHTIIAGATGSGKSVAENGIIYTLLHYTPGQMQMILIDPKKVELRQYKKVPHCLRYVDESKKAVDTLADMVATMEWRYKKMQKQGVKEWQCGHMYIIIDEYADLITTHKKQVEPLIFRLAQLGRAAHIHLLILTQRPTRDIIGGQLAVNIDSRIALRCPTAQDSRNIIHTKGAETLPRYGYGYQLTPETMRPVCIEIPYIEQSKIDQIIEYWTK